MNGHDGNVAFKCTYNDGGDRGFVGFGGTCSNGNILRNVKQNRRWCSHEGNACRQFCDNRFRGQRPRHPCDESQIVDRWRFGPGTDLVETGVGEPRSIPHAREEKVALLTTRHPECDTEPKRIVFGVYKIMEISEEENGEIFLQGNADSAILLSETAAFALPYWKFKTHPRGGPAWGTGLFRYISDQEVTNFLHALYPHLRSARDRTVLETLLECCGNLAPEPVAEEANGEAMESALKEKYGPGGEGEPHRVLKQLIADQPERLGLGRGRCAVVEHRFVTGDRVDVSIDLANGEHCVVEIEVEGESTSIGAHQALKYRALRAGQLDSTVPPHACLVAYSIPQHVKDFCKRHDVLALEIQP